MQTQNPFEEIAERLSRIEHCLLDLKDHKQSNHAQPETPDLLTISQAAEMLHLSVATLYTKISIKKRELPFMKRGGRVYFSRAELLQFLKDGRRSTRQEIQEQAKHSLSGKKK